VHAKLVISEGRWVINYFEWFELAGVTTKVKGYDGFVEITRQVMQTRSPQLQRVTSMLVIHSAVPPWLLKIVNKKNPPMFELIYFKKMSL